MSHQPDFAAVKAKLPKVEPASTAAAEKGGAKKEKQKDEGGDIELCKSRGGRIKRLHF